jgi:hypothetical protein
VAFARQPAPAGNAGAAALAHHGHLRRHDLILKCRNELLRLSEPKPKVGRAGLLIALDASNLSLRQLTGPQFRHQFHPPHQLRHQANPLPVSPEPTPTTSAPPTILNALVVLSFYVPLRQTTPYRARLAASGKAVRVVDAAASPAPPAIPAFDPATQIVCDREQFERIDDKLGNALSKVRFLTDSLQRLEQRNAFLETGLKREEQNHTNKIKEVIVLKQQLAQAEQRPKKSRKT